MRISAPPTANPCFFGIDFPTTEELAAAGRDNEAIRKLLGADTLGYLSVEGLLETVGGASHYCAACFNGEYPVEVDPSQGKSVLERYQPLLNLNSKETSG